MSLQKQFQLTYHIQPNSYESNVWIISPFGYAAGTQSCVGTLTSLPTYQAYSTLFDEFKLNSISVRFNVTRTLSGFSDATTDFMTCIDRHGNLEDITNRMTLKQVEDSSSAVRTTFNGQSTFSTTRSYRATDFMEKYTFYDATYHDDTTNGRYIDSWYGNANNIGFTPLIYSALKTTMATSSATRDITCTADITFNLTFRNPKNGMTTSSAKAAAEAADPDAKVTIVTEEEDETPPEPEATTKVDDPGETKMTDDPPQ